MLPARIPRYIIINVPASNPQELLSLLACSSADLPVRHYSGLHMFRKDLSFKELLSFNGTVFVCSYLYQIAHLGDDDEEPEFSSAMPLEEGDTFFFQPRPLKNLVLVDEQENLSPIMSCQVSS